MNIQARYRLTTASVLAATALIGAAIWWAHGEVTQASEQRQMATDIGRRLNELRMVTMEYAVEPHERVVVQWQKISENLDRLLGSSTFPEVAEKEILAHLVARRAKAVQTFRELSVGRARSDNESQNQDARRRFEAQLLNQLLIVQQENRRDAIRLGDLANRKISSAQTQVVTVILGGLALIALISIGGFLLISRRVIAPIVSLQLAAQRIESGSPGPTFKSAGNDEIGRLAQSLDRMTQSMQISSAEIRNRNEELRALNIELEAFSYSVSHDLRAPLRAMDGFSMILLEDHAGQLNEEGKAALARIRAASQRMGALIDDLLRLANVTRARLELKPVDLGIVTREIAGSVALAHPGRQVRWEIGEGMTLQADPSLIAMRNLLENAWKFSGKVAQAVIRVGVRVQDGRRAFFVADNGAGFDPAYASRLFEVFQRLHHASEFEGTGIGLAIVQRIVHRHHGRIWAEATPGAGATFFFTVGDVEANAHG